MFQIPKNPNLSLECIKGSNPILGISQNSPGFLGNNWKNWIRLTCKVFEVPKYLLTSEEPFSVDNHPTYIVWHTSQATRLERGSLQLKDISKLGGSLFVFLGGNFNPDVQWSFTPSTLLPNKRLYLDDATATFDKHQPPRAATAHPIYDGCDKL